MEKFKMYGQKPFSIALIHGGPGAPGGMKSLAEELSKKYSIIEPYQSCNSIDGQVEELKEILTSHAALPVVLIGHSWGAWLSYLFASKYPQMVSKIILIGCGAFESKYLSKMNSTRSNALTNDENQRVSELFEILNDPNASFRKEALQEFGSLMAKSDAYSPISLENETLDFQPDVFGKCMNELTHIRNTGALLDIGKTITCPVLAIHGMQDPHPHEGVEEPLRKTISNFKFVLLENCGHTPWNEEYAKDQFYKVLYDELSIPVNDNSSFIKKYQELNKDEAPRRLATTLLEYITEKSKIADMGCGAGMDSLYFIKAGHDVIAIDREIGVIEALKEQLEEPLKHRLEIIKADFMEQAIPCADILYASYSLPFCPPQQFDGFWSKLEKSINPNGIIAATFFGTNDDWFKNSEHITFHERESLVKLFKGYEIKNFYEEEFEDTFVSREGTIESKHWHVFEIIAQRKQHS